MLHIQSYTKPSPPKKKQQTRKESKIATAPLVLDSKNPIYSSSQSHPNDPKMVVQIPSPKKVKDRNGFWFTYFFLRKKKMKKLFKKNTSSPQISSSTGPSDVVPPPSRCTAGRSAQHPGATDVPHSGRSSCGPLDLSTEAMPVDSARDCYNSIQVRSFPAKLLMGINIWILYNRDQWSPTPTGSGVGGVDPTFLIMYEHKGGVNPLTFCQKCMGTRGG